MPDSQGRLETFLTLVLADQTHELAAAHDELYPERVLENIPLSITLLYPWVPAASLQEHHLDEVRAIMSEHPAPTFDLVRIETFPGLVAYVAPEPDTQLRAIMRRLWETYPDYPPYGEPGGDPPPHCTLGRLEGEHAVGLEEVRRRVEPLLPITCHVRHATLLEEYEPDRFRTRAVFPFADPKDIAHR